MYRPPNVERRRQYYKGKTRERESIRERGERGETAAVCTFTAAKISYLGLVDGKEREGERGREHDIMEGEG